MQQLNRTNLLGSLLCDALNDSLALPQEVFLQCFRDAAKGKAIITSQAEKSLGQIHERLLSDFNKNATEEFVNLMKERNILEACAKVDEKENVYRSLEEETKEQFKLAAELEQERKEHEQLMESLSELRKNYDTFIEDLVTATQVVKT